MTQPRFSDLFATFLRIGVLSFGGPAAQIALMHRVLVDERNWLTEKQYLDALSFCMLLPGPEAMQLATYSGWRLRGVPGGILAGLLFVIPGALVIFALAALYVAYGALPLVDTLFLGVKAAVLVIVLEALLKVSKRALKGPYYWVIAVLAFIGIFFLALPFPLIVIAAATIGALFARGAKGDALPVRRPWSQTVLVSVVGLAVWLIPLAALDVLAGQTILPQIGAFFSKLAVVSFGGAYAVLAYMAQDVVTAFGWLTADEMLDSLGLAETTPGPLILVTQFVGFVAGFRDGGYLMATGAALVTLWVTFVPCFLWIFAGAPYIEWIADQPRLRGALTAITAAVVGVIGNLSIWFGLNVLFDEVTRVTTGIWTLWVPDLTTLDWRAAGLTLFCTLLILRLKMPLGWALMTSASASVVITAVTGF
ncbi:chromate efflux transporter [Aliiroseovarius lamellibrachiae]|uniref:chromate efflux transporter n=1 Tax=Aliiroseovarius lamellibrachiae TaxID=1924933 RepID=UPI001BDFF695|nr:chromate efflux transporter [Aliiroseovarius lamellibrachiae]MBT2131432.1 chromate efflux transporter [Aliiroseovarius lamellibrachiae]